jgi:beta-glucanase (GH16 family)
MTPTGFSRVRFSTVVLIAASALALTHGQDPPGASPIRSLPRPGTMFADEFSAPALDRSKWNVIVTGQTVNDEQQAYVDSPETIALVKGDAAQGADDGALEIRTRYKPGFLTPQGKRFDFISGRIDTRGRFDFTYGTAEARIKLTPGAGLWPAFWALGNDKWPDTGEMDILENVGDPTWTNFALHGPGYSGASALVDRKYFDAGTSIADWHVYAMAWTPETIVFRVDGRDAYRVTRRTVEQHGRWAYDNPKHLIVNQAIGGVYPHAVNKTDVPYLGLPQSTVDLVKADKAVMLVDWVRVLNSPTVQ